MVLQDKARVQLSGELKKEIIDLLSAREKEQIHGSTGTVECCSSMVVTGKSDPDPTTGERTTNWIIVKNLTVEASLLFHTLKDSLVTESISEAEFTSEATADSHGGSDTRVEVSQASSTGKSHSVEEPTQPSLFQKMMARLKSFTRNRFEIWDMIYKESLLSRTELCLS